IITKSTTPTLMITISRLVLAASLMPRRRLYVMMEQMTTEGRLMAIGILNKVGRCMDEYCTVSSAIERFAAASSNHIRALYRSKLSYNGRCTWSSPRSFRTYPDQPIATVEDANEYSRIRSQPMIHAKSSPNVAKE